VFDLNKNKITLASKNIPLAILILGLMHYLQFVLSHPFLLLLIGLNFDCILKLFGLEKENVNECHEMPSFFKENKRRFLVL
jgi:hypothetical protein